MSYQIRARNLQVVVCDGCGEWGAIGDWSWREARCNRQGVQLHLCRACRRSVVWCETHDEYHQPDSLHRQPCRTCGGLFTAPVLSLREHCPTCQRALPATPDQRPATGSLRGLLRAWVARLSHS